MASMRPIPSMVPVSDALAVAASIWDGSAFDAPAARAGDAHFAHGNGALCLIAAPPGAHLHGEYGHRHRARDSEGAIDAFGAANRAPWWGMRAFHAVDDALPVSPGQRREAL